jgi:hypothetical protein
MKTILRSSGDQYFLTDALRDLVVVVVGILAALYLESWWQDRQDRAEEAVLLAGLRDELVSNKAHLVEVMSSWSDVAESAEQALALMGKPVDVVDPESAVRTFRSTMGIRFFDPRIGQMSSLVSSGKLGLIQNPLLRAKIADWPSLVEDLDVERQASFYALMEGFGPLLGQFIPSRRDSPFDDRLGELLTNRAIHLQLDIVAGIMNRALGEGSTILQATDDIISLIDTLLTDHEG